MKKGKKPFAEVDSFTSRDDLANYVLHSIQEERTRRREHYNVTTLADCVSAVSMQGGFIQL
jgi:hypothetical protein